MYLEPAQHPLHGLNSKENSSAPTVLCTVLKNMGRLKEKGSLRVVLMAWPREGQEPSEKQKVLQGVRENKGKHLYAKSNHFFLPAHQIFPIDNQKIP